MKSPARKLSSAAAAIALSLGLAFSLSGCFANPIEKMVNDSVGDAVKKATGVEVDVSQDGKSLPKDFPDSVPLIDGEVTFAGAMGAGGGKVWTVTLKVKDVDGAFETIKSQLSDAGFTEEFSTSDGKIAAGSYSGSDKLNVMFTVENKKNGVEAGYVVSGKK